MSPSPHHASEPPPPREGSASALSVEPADFFVLRTPLLPFDALEAWGEGLGTSGGLKEDRARLRERLRAHVARPDVREALFVASPSLDEGLEQWHRDPDSQAGRKAELALVRYFLRMVGRCTPFGLFAACSLGRSGERTRLVVADAREARRDTRLDMDYLTRLVDALVRDPALREVLRYRPNASLYRAAGRLRYVETRHEGATRRHHLSAVTPDACLERVLERARGGARVEELARALVALDSEVALEEAADFVRTLIDNDLLVPELSVPVTGPAPLRRIVEQLRAVAEQAGTGQAARLASEAVGCLEDVGGMLERLDAEGTGRPREAYHAIAARLESLPAKVDLPRLFQVDLYKPAPEAVLGPDVRGEVSRAVELLWKLSPGADAVLKTFIESFTRRYGGREVPLLEALDEESGVGFLASDAPGAEGAPLLRGLGFPGADSAPPPLGAREAHLLRRMQTAPGAHVLSLEAKDLEALAGAREPAPLADSLCVAFTVAAASEEALARGEYSLLVRGVSGPSGANLLGRFCHGDAALREGVERHLRVEESFRPDALHAEVVHLPEGRVGNVLLRPLLRGYEIPFLGTSGAPEEGQLCVQDLLVSVVDGRVVLRSRRLGREVLPRLSTAHSYAVGLGVYRFLCMLQHQGVAAGLGWSWGALESLDFLPRVVSGRVVLSQARWRLREEALAPLGAAKGEERFRAVRRLREVKGLPRYVALVEGDNVLPLDLDNVLCVDSLVALVKERSQVVLRELFPGAEALCARGPEGRFVHELLLPLVRRHEGAPAPRPEQRRAPGASVTHVFPPGSEWLYAKLYTGVSGVDEVLRSAVTPLVERLVAGSAVDRWFFIRYGDPDWHLRLRLHGGPARLHGEALPALYEALASLSRDGLVWKLQLDTYEREVERYGGPEGVVLSEALFHADSDAVLRLLALLEGDAGAEARWKLTLRGMDLLLDDLGLDARAKLAVAEHSRESFGRELRATGAFMHQLGARFRQARAGLDAAWAPDGGGDDLLVQGLAVLRERSARIGPLGRRLETAWAEGRLTVPVPRLAGSYLHMYANRLLRSAARAQELVLYDFLVRTYRSRLARTRAEEQ